MIVNAGRLASLHRSSLPGLFGVAALCVLVGALGIANRDLWTADEPREAGIAREMWRSGSWLVPRLSGEAFLEKPPLYWWTQAAVFHAFDRADPALARLPSALFGLGTLALCSALARRFFTRPVSSLAALVLLTTWIFALRSHWAIVDMALVFGVTGAITCSAWSESSSGWRRQTWLAGAAAFLAIGFFSKGPIGIGIPVLGVGCFLLWRGRLRSFAAPLLLGGSVVALLAAAWLWQVASEEGAAGVQTFLVRNQLGRLLPGGTGYDGGHRQPLFYYLLQAPLEFLPWSPAALLAAGCAWRNWDRLGEAERTGLQLIACINVPVLLILSAAGTKRGLYLLPLAPFVALLVAWWMSRELPRSDRETRLESAWRRAVLAAAAALPALPLLVDPGAWPWLGASAALALLAFASESDRHAERVVRWSRSLLLTGSAWACLLVAGPPLLDRTKSLAPAARELDRMVPSAAELHALAPTETLRGMVAFYTDRPLRVVPGVPELRALAARNDVAWLVLEADRRRWTPQVLRSAGIPHEILATLHGGGRSFHLLRIGRIAEVLR